MPPSAPPAAPVFLGVSPLPPLTSPPAPATLVAVAPEALPPMTLEVTPVVVPEETVPYVAPVRVPKPYRN